MNGTAVAVNNDGTALIVSNTLQVLVETHRTEPEVSDAAAQSGRRVCTYTGNCTNIHGSNDAHVM